jgi:hypothetical protein
MLTEETDVGQNAEIKECVAQLIFFMDKTNTGNGKEGKREGDMNFI